MIRGPVFGREAGHPHELLKDGARSLTRWRERGEAIGGTRGGAVVRLGLPPLRWNYTAPILICSQRDHPVRVSS